MWPVLGWILFVVIILYSTRKFWRPPPKKIDPKGKVVLVTGAASGFGLCTTKQLVAKGCCVLAVDINQEALEKEFGSQKESVRTFICDVSKTESVERLFDEVQQVLKERKDQSLFGLVNNAGIALPAMALLDTPEEKVERVWEINAMGMWRVTRAFFPVLEKQAEDKGCIVNITSVAGIMSGPFTGAYCMSKYAAEAFSDAVRREIAPTGVRLSIIEPYFANTPILNALNERAHFEKSDYKEQIKKAVGVVEQVKLLAPETIAESICESLFTSPCRTRIRVAFWYDQILIWLICDVLPDWVTDKILTNLSPKVKKE